MKYFLFAGESSGDLYGSLLMNEIAHIDSKAEFKFWGGEKMISVSPKGRLVDISEVAIMGFLDVLKNVFKLSKLIGLSKKAITEWKPDVIIFIDYPGLNLRMAKWARKKGYYNVYYICPKIWAWRQYRAKSIKRDIDLMICILPFEPDYLSNKRIEGKYFGHPLINQLKDYTWKSNPANKGILSIFPGSRKSELKFILPIVNQLITNNTFSKYKISKIPHIPKDYYKRYLNPDHPNVELIEDNYSCMVDCEMALVKSGTTSLEAAIIGTPQIVVYKADPISYSIAKRLVKLSFISLPNLILNRMVVSELLQDNLNLENLIIEIKNLRSPERLKELTIDYADLRTKLASDNSILQAVEAIRKGVDSNKVNSTS